MSPEPSSADHYFSARPDAPSARRELELVLPEGRRLKLTTDRGVFSADRVDPGTRFLLSEGPPLAGATTLADLGCGYGPIAITQALRAPDAVVWAVEVNERARDLCRENAAANGVGDRVRVVAPHEVPPSLVLDQIWSNPPIRVGKKVLHDLLGTWLDRLRPSAGSATVVVQKHLGADSLARWLTDAGWPTERVGARSGYRLLHVSPRSEATRSAPDADNGAGS